MPDILEDVIKCFHKRRAHSLVLSCISINNAYKIQGNIMAISFGRAEKVTATVIPLDQFGAPMTASSLLAFSAVSSNTGVFTVANINETALTCDLVGVSDGSATITFGGTDTNGKAVTFLVDNVTIADVLLATTLQVVYGPATHQ